MELQNNEHREYYWGATNQVEATGCELSATFTAESRSIPGDLQVYADIECGILRHCFDRD